MPISLTTLGSAYTQNFDTLSNTAGSTTNNLTLNGWFMTETGGGARDNEQYAVDTGVSNTGDTFSYGAAANADRALGGLRSGTLIPVFGAEFTNNTGATITSLDIAYIGEQWRLGTAARTDQINFEYSLNATSLTTGTWTGVAALNFVTPTTATTGAKDGNLAANRTSTSSTIMSLNIPDGATFWIRWTDTDASGADDGLAVDDFSLTPQGVPTLPTLDIDDVSQTEGPGGTTIFTFTVSLSAPAGPGGVTFDIATADDSATTADNDYVAQALTGQVIAMGSSTYTFNVTVNGDAIPEPTESFFVNVTNITGATAGDTQGLGTILTDDAPPSLSIDDVTVTEGNAGATQMDFTVSLSAPAGPGGVTFDIGTADGSASDTTDYVLVGPSGRTIAEGESSLVVTILVATDLDVEPDETFFVNISNVVGADVTDPQGLGTILNDDFAGTVTIADATVSEAAGTVTLTLTRSGGNAAFTVDYATADGSATAPGDYVAETGQVGFGLFQTTATITIDLVDDAVGEDLESFLVNLTGASNGGVIGDASASVTIRDEDPIALAALDVAYTQNFDGLASSGTTNVMPLAGWFISESDDNANNLYAASSGSSTSGDTYSFGDDSDRALGSLASGSLLSSFGAAFINETGVSLTSILIGFSAEQWRLGATPRLDRLDFAISFDATSLATGTWLDVDPLDIVTFATAPTGAKDGNVVTAALSFEITNLLVSSGTGFWIRWTDADSSGSDDGLAVDDFSLIAKSTPGISIADVSHVEGDAGTSIYSFSVALDAAAGPGGVSFDIATADGDATVAGGDYVARALTGQIIPEGERFYTFDVTVNADLVGEFDEAFFVNLSNVVGTAVTDGQARGIIRNDDPLPIHIVQGPGHSSPFANQIVETRGIVTARDNNGFWIQTPDAEVDADLRTSEGIFVFTGSAPPPEAAIGNLLLVTATVTEFVGGAGDLSVTELTGAALSVLSTGNPLPAAVLIGAGGRVVPNAIYDDDGFTSFDIATDGLDFYESLEGMRVTIEAPRVVSETSSFGETYVVASNGAGATGINARGGITISEGDMNPERIQIDADGDLFAGYAPNHSIGDTLGNVTGILNYGFSSYEVLVTQAVTVTGNVTLGLEQTALAGGPGTLAIASYNVENLDPFDGAAKFQQHALDIVQGMGSPDIIGLQEVQDADGAGGGADTSGAATAQVLIDAIVAAGGPTYAYVEIAPAAGTTGGEPGGNIRNGYLYNPARVSYVPGSAELIDTPVYSGTRRPLVADFLFLGETVTVVDLHLTSRIGSDGLFGANQPPINAGDDSRLAQAQGVRDYLDSRFGPAGGDNVVVLGDFNSFYFEAPSDAIEAGGAYINLYETLAPQERYSAIFEGNLQGLDNIVVSANLYGSAQFDAVHRNSEQLQSAGRSDHDPVVALLVIDAMPVAAADAYQLDEDTLLVVGGAGVLANDSDLDGSGLPGNQGALNAILVDGPDHAAAFTLNADGTFSYAPTADYNGADSFSYKPNDGRLDGNIVTVTLTVLAVNDAPVGAAESYNVVEDSSLSVPATGVLGNDVDVDGPALTAMLVSGPSFAAAFALNPDGSFSYTPLADYAGPDSFSYRPSDGALLGDPVTVTLDVIAEEDAAIARNDGFAILESAILGGNIFADNGSGADSDPDSPLAVAAVNGSALAVGQQVVLPSGALLTVNADGTFSYDPNGRFNTLTIAATGASNLGASDVFTYSLAGGGTATVLIDIGGERTFDDWLVGAAGNDVVTGNGFNDSFFMQQGGQDRAIGNGGNDGFYFGAALTNADIVDGGLGNDSLAIQGHYPFILLGDVNVEVIAILPGNDTRFGDLAGNFYDYSLATSDANVNPGTILTIVAGNLRPGEDLVFNGSAESDGSFRIFAGRGVDTLTGGLGNDGFLFGNDGNLTGADRVDGGGGIDSVALRGNYAGAGAIVFQNASLAGIEVIALLSGLTNQFGGQIVIDGFDYDLTLADGNVGAGQSLDVVATGLAQGEVLRFDGRAELDGALRIFSGAGDDTLYGSAGADLISGGLGADRLEGGPGNDLYLYRSVAESTAASPDTIAGFVAGDRIDLSPIDADPGTGANDAFAFIGTGAFTGVAGQLRYAMQGGDALVQGDVDGDGVADLAILIENWTPVAADFIL